MKSGKRRLASLSETVSFYLVLSILTRMRKCVLLQNSLLTTFCCGGCDQGVVSKPCFYKANHLFNRAHVSESDEFSATPQDTYKGMYSFSDSSTKGDIEDLSNVFSHIVLSTLFVKTQKSNRLYRFGE